MNKSTRKRIADEILAINKIIDRISDISSGEEDKLGSIPENLEGSEMYNKIEDAIDFMASAIESLEEAVENLEACNENC
ncbi:MAG: hypothetical protein J6T96_05305 [Bacteroidales bacterium]|nr:hypothetical protein [Bacteroidales bacterium]